MVDYLKPITFGIFLALFTVLPSYGKTAPQAVQVLFEDKTIILVNTWTFVYSFGESDTPVPSFEYTEKSTKDLMIHMQGAPSHPGFTVNEERKIPGDQIEYIRFNWSSAENRVDGVSIKLSGKKVFKVKNLTSAGSLISEKKYFFGAGRCPCIYFKGVGTFKSVKGSFEYLISNHGRWTDNELKPNEKIVELRFQ